MSFEIVIPLITACILLGTELMRMIRRGSAPANAEKLNILLVETLEAIDKNVESLCTATDLALKAMPDRLESLERAVKRLSDELDRPAKTERVT